MYGSWFLSTSGSLQTIWGAKHGPVSRQQECVLTVHIVTPTVHALTHIFSRSKGGFCVLASDSLQTAQAQRGLCMLPLWTCTESGGA